MLACNVIWLFSLQLKTEIHYVVYTLPLLVFRAAISEKETVFEIILFKYYCGVGADILYTNVVIFDTKRFKLSCRSSKVKHNHRVYFNNKMSPKILENAVVKEPRLLCRWISLQTQDWIVSMMWTMTMAIKHATYMCFSFSLILFHISVASWDCTILYIFQLFSRALVLVRFVGEPVSILADLEERWARPWAGWHPIAEHI